MLLRWILLLGLMCTACAPATREEVAPEVEVDLVSTLVESLRGIVEDGSVVGAAGLAAKDGEIVFRGAAGYADRESNQVMTSEHLFRIASMTKPVTSVAAMILVEEGLMALDDPVSKFVPAFGELSVLEAGDDGSSRVTPATNDVTVRHLLTHTSGLNYRFIAREPLASYYVDANISDGLVRTEWDLEAQVQKLAALPLTHQPGAAFTYGLSTDVLGYVVEVVSGQSLDVFFRERIFDPLSMNDTHFFLAEEDWGRLATVYRPDGAGALEPITGTVEDGQTFFSVDAATEGPRVYLSGGGGLVSSLDDYFRFCQMILNGGELDGVRVLKQETVALMTQNQIGELSLGLDSDKFGLGFALAQASQQGRPLGALGWGGFYGTQFLIDPNNRIVMVFMSQIYDLPRGQEIPRRFGDDVFRVLLPQPASDD